MASTYRRLPASPRALARRPLTPTDRRNPAPSSLATRITMVANVGRGTSPELALRRALRTAGARGYRLNFRAEGLRPDIVFTRRRVAVFLHGCFWHRCPTCRYPLPKSHRGFWLAKFRRNRQRDRAKRALLERAGWRVVEVWEHELRDEPTIAAARVVRTLARAGSGAPGVRDVLTPHKG